jgi:ABC-type phosphate/phosphonate transport system permease subunit
VRFTYLVEVEVERTEGKFASREEVEEQITDALESADPGSVDGIGADGDSSYEVISWDVQPQEQPKRKRGSH